MAYFAIHHDQNAVMLALALCKGCYQRDLIMGYESLSGATLKGKAKNFGGKYRDSRKSILSRMTLAGIPWHETKGKHNKRILVIGKES